MMVNKKSKKIDKKGKVGIKINNKIDKKTGEDLLLCPRCRVYMKKLVKKDVVIDICKKCGGMWVDRGELEKLAQIGSQR